MPIWSLTKEKVDKLLAECAAKEGEIDALVKLSPKDLWRTDIEHFLKVWHQALADDEERARKKSVLKKSRKVKTAAGKRAANKLISGVDVESDDDFIIKPKKAAPKATKAAPKMKQMKLTNLKPTGDALRKLKEPDDGVDEREKDIFDMSDDDAKNHTPIKRVPARAAAAKSMKVIDLSDEDDDQSETEVIRKPNKRVEEILSG